MEGRKKEPQFDFAKFNIAEIDIADINFDEMLGSGGYGSVYSATWNKLPCAIKFFNGISGGNEANRNRSHYEELCALAFLNISNVPNIIQLYGASFTSRFIVLEYAVNGDLDYHIDKRTYFPRHVRYSMMIEAADALRYMHGVGLIHCDIKPANILLTADFHVRVCDLNLAVSSQDAVINHHNLCTEYYAAPELSQGGHVTKSSDMYAWGLTFWSVHSKRHPFGPLKATQEILKDKLTGEPVSISKPCNRRVAHLFKACMRVDPDQRPDAERALTLLTRARDHVPAAKKNKLNQ